mmetsp:Transcript_35862/g.47486  ORF Transcript_35862/g.47486 Transcript_35862/m.47486 type:complete len:150 (+) Transcript_35862:352-801(+)
MLAVSAQVSILFFPGGDTRGFESKVFSNADCDCQSKLVCFCSKMPYSPRLNFIFVTLYFFDRGWVVGYLTNTGIKFLAVIEDTNDKQQQQSRESDLKHLFELLHDYYVEHTLNPFSKIRAKISSRRFDAGVSKSVGLFNRNYVSKEFWM